MNRKEIMERLDDLEVEYETDANKPALQELLDEALVAETDDEVEVEVEGDKYADMSLEKAEELVRDRKKNLAEFNAMMLAAGKVISAANPPKPRASLAECVNRFQDGIKRDSKLKRQVPLGKGEKEGEEKAA